MSEKMRIIYIDSIDNFTEHRRYTTHNQKRFAYLAPLPALAIIVTRAIPLSDLLHKTVGVYLGHMEPAEPGTPKAWGHFPQLRQSKISIIQVFPEITARQTLSELLKESPQYGDDAYAHEMGL